MVELRFSTSSWSGFDFESKAYSGPRVISFSKAMGLSLLQRLLSDTHCNYKEYTISNYRYMHYNTYRSSILKSLQLSKNQKIHIHSLLLTAKKSNNNNINLIDWNSELLIKNEFVCAWARLLQIERTDFAIFSLPWVFLCCFLSASSDRCSAGISDSGRAWRYSARSWIAGLGSNFEERPAACGLYCPLYTWKVNSNSKIKSMQVSFFALFYNLYVSTV